MMLPVYVAKDASPAEFIEFWAQQYRYPKDAQYTNNIGQTLTPERIRELFEWKNGAPLSTRKQLSVERNYISRIEELESLFRIEELKSLSQESCAADFLQRFPSGGAIWRIFLLHCWQPERFPMYDQHVHRAMEMIERGEPGEIPASDAEKVNSYLSRYLRFVQRFEGCDPRQVDRALWAYGKFVKGKRFENGNWIPVAEEAPL
jgi:hypothetical protein